MKNKLYSSRIYFSCCFVLIIGIYMLVIDPSYIVGSIISILAITVIVSFFLYSKNSEPKKGIITGECYRIIKIYPDEKIVVVVARNGNNFDLFTLTYDYFIIEPNSSKLDHQFMGIKNRKNKIKLIEV